MAITRAQAITQTQKKVEVYSDFTNNFIRHPITNELVTVKNEDAVRQAFKNLILTNINERFFNPFFGSNVNTVLFDNFGPFMIEDIVKYVNMSAKQFENRVTVLSVTVTDQSDSNAIAINVVFSLINNPTVPLQLNLFVKRVR
jgi:phage baseplate assembly protein W